MRWLIVFIIGLSACSASDFSGYMPVEETYLVEFEKRIEGSFISSKGYDYSRELDQRNKLALRIISSSDKKTVFVNLYFYISPSSSFKLLDNRVSVTNLSNGDVIVRNFDQLRQAVIGSGSEKGKILYYKPLEAISFENIASESLMPITSSVQFEQKTLSDCIVLKLPIINLNNQNIEIEPISFIKMIDGIGSKSDCNYF